MPRTAAEIVELLDLEQIDANLFRGRQPDTRLQRVFGGQVAGQALIAAYRTVSDEFDVHSLHAYFLRPGDPSVPIVYDVEPMRDGRSFATRRVVARQHGHGIFFLTADFQRPEEGFDHQDVMPAVGSPEDGLDVAEIVKRRESKAGPGAPTWESEWSALEVRYVGGEPDDEHVARTRLWIRIGGELPDDRVLQQAAFTYASDLTLLGSSLTPHDRFIGSPDVQAASLDHAIWFHRPFRADDWWLYDQHSPSASGGRGLALARVFAPDGALVASVAQEGLIRRARG